VVRSPADVMLRMPLAHVIGISSGVYPEALFYHRGILFEVTDIDADNMLIRCTPVQDTGASEVVLAAELVNRLVESFGS
jgi:hypothetical protein